jgi:predicted RNase H-like HicB family nuclease
MKYLIVIEQTATGYSAYSPDVPGCIATGDTRDEAQREMKDAMQFHLDGLRAEGLEIPKAHSSSSRVEIAPSRFDDGQ